MTRAKKQKARKARKAQQRKKRARLAARKTGPEFGGRLTGKVRMSEVLHVVAEPILDEVWDGTSEDFRKLMQLVIIGWNMTLVDSASCQEKLDRAVQEHSCDGPEIRAMLQWICDLVAERKAQLYPQLNKFILDVRFQDQPNGDVYFEVVHMDFQDPDPQ